MAQAVARHDQQTASPVLHEPVVQVKSPELVVPERPSLGSGVRLAGPVSDSGFRTQQWLVRRDRKFIQVTELLYRVLECADGLRTLDEIAEYVASATGRPVSANNVGYLIEKRLLPLGLIAARGGERQETRRPRSRSPLKIIVRKQVLPARAIEPVSQVLQVLFFPPVVAATLVVIVLSQWWVFAVHGLAAAFQETLARPELLLVLTALLVASGPFHEFGHAAALRYGGGAVRGMGVGMYLIYPAFYTDVTDSYRLGRRAKVRTDLGGVYFSLIFALAVQALYLMTRQEYLLLFVLITDLDVLDQFSPFLRFDGYWVLVDLTGLPDFFTLMGPFLRSLVPWSRSSAGRLPPLKRWVKAVFAVYCVVTIPLLAILFVLMVKTSPVVLSLTWQALQQQAADFRVAQQANDLARMGVQAFRMLMVGLPALGLVLSLGLLFLTALGALRAGFRWSRSRPLVWLTAALVVICLVLPASVTN